MGFKTSPAWNWPGASPPACHSTRLNLRSTTLTHSPTHSPTLFPICVNRRLSAVKTFLIFPAHRSPSFNSCSHIRTTRQPNFLNVRFTSRSLTRFLASFFTQNGRLLRGIRACLGHPCQKHPSTSTTTFSRANRKSGRPKIGRCRRHPVMPCCRKILINASSVSLFPRPRIFDITSDRFCFVKTSGITQLNHKNASQQPSAQNR
jgi:hypothetical protein